MEMDLLAISWRPVNRRSQRMLLWAEQDIQHIGQRYQSLESGEKRGEKWAIETGELRQAVNQYLQQVPAVGEATASGSRWQRMFGSTGGKGEEVQRWPDWWRGLRDLTRSFDNALKNHMYVADKELRKTAADLHDLSKEALWS